MYPTEQVIWNLPITNETDALAKLYCLIRKRGETDKQLTERINQVRTELRKAL